MIKHYYECDVCGKKLPTKTKQTPFGEVEIVCGTGTTKEWNTKGLFQHLCKGCALTIDKQAELLLKEINDRFEKQNDMLREHTALLTEILDILRKESEYGSNRNV